MKPFYEKSVNIPASAGFTIIEVLIALAIFSLGIMAMGALQTASLRSTGNIAQMTEALALLDERAESLKVLPFYVAPFPNFDPDLVAGTHMLPAPRGSGDQFDVHWLVTDNTPIPQQPHTQLEDFGGGWGGGASRESYGFQNRHRLGDPGRRHGPGRCPGQSSVC